MINHVTKKFYLSAAGFVLALLLCTPVKAQHYGSNPYDYKSIKLGLSLSPNLGWLRYENDYSADTKPGFAYGLLADIGFARNYYFSTGLLINSINSKVSTNDANYLNRDISLKYAEVPLAVKLKSEPNNLGRFYGQFGFTAGLKVSGKEKLYNESGKSSISGDDLFRLGLQIGGGMEWALNDNLAIMTGLSFNNGFTRAIKHENPKTSYVALNLGLFF